MRVSSEDARSVANRRAIQGAESVVVYTNYKGLQKGEVAIFARVEHEFYGKRILDIGVGGGRITPALLAISRRYVGIDVASGMINYCRSRFPDVQFEIRDVVGMSDFPDACFDFVMFSFTGIDCLEHAGRLRAFAEIHRVLASGGAFAFSSHNRRARIVPPWARSRGPLQINFFRHPRQFLKRTYFVLLETKNHMSNRRHEHYEKEYAILNDPSHHYGMFLYYINVEHQVTQLTNVGFETNGVVDLRGNWLCEEDYDTCRDDWLYYLCRKA